MYEEMTIVNKDGFIVEKKVLFKYGEPMFFDLKDGEKAVPYCDKELVKGQLVNNEWIETATEEEINIYNRCLNPFNTTQ